MITQESINNVLDTADIYEVVKDHVDLTKRGANYTGCCPFHDEKTPSFSVSPVKGIYKCFGCGASGNAITFIMEKKKLEFPDAVRTLADKFNLTLEETHDREEDKIVKEKRLTMIDMNKGALGRWQKAFYDLPKEHWASVASLQKQRMLTRESIAEFQIGYAPDEWRFITKHIVDGGFYEFGNEMGLISRNDKGDTYDFFRNRIIFPIHDMRGQIIGFCGRKAFDNNEDRAPKYINSKESMLYKKNSVLYGIFQAQSEIRKQGVAIVVEGQVDVIMMHQAGIKNTVCPGGTALTAKHAEILKKMCKKVILMFDGDKAGKEATLKAIDVLIEQELNVVVVPIRDNDDPDVLVRSEFPECCVDEEIEIAEEGK